MSNLTPTAPLNLDTQPGGFVRTNFRYNISKTCVICGNLFIADMLSPTVEDTCSNCVCSHCESNGELLDYGRDVSSYELEQILNPCGYRTRAVMYE